MARIRANATKTGIDDPALVNDCGDGPRLVLVAVDESEGALQAASFAADLARRNRAHLIVVHLARLYPPPVWPDLSEMPWSACLDDRAVTCDWPVSTADDGFLDGLLTILRQQYQVDAEGIVRQRLPTREIAGLAWERHADIIVLGGSRSLLHRIAGSLANRVIRRRTWPVLVVP